MVEMLGGSTKARFNQDDRNSIDLNLMKVIRGDEFVNYLPDALWLEIPFTSDLGPFSLRVSFSLMAQESNEITNKNRICQSNRT